MACCLVLQSVISIRLGIDCSDHHHRSHQKQVNLLHSLSINKFAAAKLRNFSRSTLALKKINTSLSLRRNIVPQWQIWEMPSISRILNKIVVHIHRRSWYGEDDGVMIGLIDCICTCVLTAVSVETNHIVTSPSLPCQFNESLIINIVECGRP